MQVVDQDADDVAVVLVAQADVVKAAGVAQGDAAAGDLVVADAPVAVAAGGGGFGAGGVDLGGSALAGGGAVRAAGVVFDGELVELGLQVSDRVGGWLGAQPLLQGLLEPFDAPMFVKRPVLAAVVLAAAGSRIPLGRGSA